MNEERMLILNMLHAGKITPAQAESLLRTLQNPEPQPTATATGRPSVSADPATLASMQNKLAELQNKIGDIQGKQIADRAARMAGQAFTLAGKVIGHIPKPEIDLKKAFDETMSGLNSLKDEAVKTAKQATSEAKRMARDAMKTGDNGTGPLYPAGPTPSRPVPGATDAAVTEEVQSTSPFAAQSLTIVNNFGNIAIEAGDDQTVQVKAAKTVWAGDEAAARVLAQQVFVTNRIDNGNHRIELIAPADALARVTVDCAVVIPRGVPCTLETTFGDIGTNGVGPVLTAKSVAGNVAAANPPATGDGDARLATRTGSIRMSGWTVAAGSVTAQTISGDITVDGLGVSRDSRLQSQSGDITINAVQSAAGFAAESASGAVTADGGSVSTLASFKTQSGRIGIKELKSGQIQVESVSGEAAVESVGGALTIKSVSGAIVARSVNSYSVALNSVSGNVVFSFAEPHSGSFAGTTVSGDLMLELDPASDASIEAASTSGRVVCALPLEGQTSGHERHVAGNLGSGAGSIRLQSISGDLTIAPPKKSKSKSKS
jgi:DUF4097 and DUF4098 domain-containing protein YvlB